MSQARVKAVSKGEIQPGKFATRHALHIDKKKFIEQMCGVKTRTADAVDLGTVPASGEGAAAAIVDVDRSLPIRGDEKESDCVIWGRGVAPPNSIEEIIKQVRGLFNIGKEVEDWSAVYYPPPTRRTGNMFIPPAPMTVAARYYICIGTAEVLRMSASVGGKSGDGKIRLADGDAVSFPIGVCTSCSVTFENGTGVTLTARPGWRAQTIKKSPHKRHILVLDGHANAGILAKAIKSSAKSATSNEKNAKELTDKFSKVMNISDVDAVAHMASLRKNPDASTKAAATPLGPNPLGAQLAAASASAPAASPIEEDSEDEECPPLEPADDIDVTPEMLEEIKKSHTSNRPTDYGDVPSPAFGREVPDLLGLDLHDKEAKIQAIMANPQVKVVHTEMSKNSQLEEKVSEMYRQRALEQFDDGDTNLTDAEKAAKIIESNPSAIFPGEKLSPEWEAIEPPSQ